MHSEILVVGILLIKRDVGSWWEARKWRLGGGDKNIYGYGCTYDKDMLFCVLERADSYLEQALKTNVTVMVATI